MEIVNGIDIYLYTKVEDWKKVKASGIDFAMIKCSQGRELAKAEGLPFTDKMFVEHLKNAHKVGIKCGAYHYLMANTVEKAIREADYAIGVLLPYKNMFNYPIACDMEQEDVYNKLTNKQNTDIIIAFLNRLEKAGFKVMIYTNQNYLKYRLEYDRLKKYDVWQAQYGPVKPTLCGDKLTIWQYSDSGTVNGIDGKVDMNYGYFNYSQNIDIDYRSIVANKCNFESQTLSYLDKYTYAEDLYKKIALEMT